MLLCIILAVTLRVLGADQGLWLDEVVTVSLAEKPLQDIVGSFSSPNNHILNTLMIKLCVLVFGEAEWVVRLPAVVFGILSIPALFWLLKPRFGDWFALSAALLLAVSYQHVFFSQNARGYSGFLFFSLVGTGMLVRGLREDRLAHWVMYVISMVLNSVLLLNSVFVIAAHAVTVAVVVFNQKGQGDFDWSLVRRFFFVYGIIALMVGNFYAHLIPEIVAVMTDVYEAQSSGYSLLSLEFAKEVIDGLQAGFGVSGVMIILPGIFAAGLGLSYAWRRDALLVVLMLSPLVFLAGYIWLAGLSASPRMFLFGLFFLLICAVACVAAIGEFAKKSCNLGSNATLTFSLLMVSALAIASLASLRTYYDSPKQDFRGAVGYIHHNRSSDVDVAVIHVAESGMRYYQSELTESEGQSTFFYTRSMPELNALISSASRGRRELWIVTTFHRALALDHPEIFNLLQSDWRVDVEFPGTIGDGDIRLWRRSK